MNNIVALNGNMNCGKLGLAFKLSKNSAIEYVRPYTDKPSQYDEELYNFVSAEVLTEMLENEEEVIYQVKIGGYRYAFFKSQLTAPYNLLILDDYGLAEVIPKYKGYLYTVKVVSSNEKPSKRVDVLSHDYDEIFDSDNDSVEELEWRIESQLPLQ